MPTINGRDVSRQQEITEAINGVFHRCEWTHLGDVPNAGGGYSTWWVVDYRPKDVRVQVLCSQLAPMVIVNAEWRIFRGDRVVRGRKTFQLGAGADTTEAGRREAATRAVERCLAIYKDVLLQTGLADPKNIDEMDRATGASEADD